MKPVLSVLCVLTALPLLAGYLGVLHPMGDSFAVFRLQGAGLLAVLSALALIAGAARVGRLGMLFALLAGVPVAWTYGSRPEAGADLRLYQKNMLFRNDDLAGLAQDIRNGAPDVVTLQEVSEPNIALLEALKPEFPHQLKCDFSSVGGAAVITRLTPVPNATICQPGLAAMQVQGPDGPIWLVSIHLHWPWPYDQATQVQDLLPVLEGLQVPVVMAGDFNMVRWSHTLATMAKAARTQPAGAVVGTLEGHFYGLTLPIDHVLSPGGGKVETRPVLGSDHLGLLADLDLTP